MRTLRAADRAIGRYHLRGQSTRQQQLVHRPFAASTATMVSTELAGPAEITTFLDELSSEYERVSEALGASAAPVTTPVAAELA